MKENKQPKIKANRKNIDLLLNLIERASWLVGNPGTNISGSTDLSCDLWQVDYEILKEELDKWK